MRQILQFEEVQRAAECRELDLVVPFTTLELSRIALAAASRFGVGLNAKIRLLRISVIPFPLDPYLPPVSIGFMRKQIESLESPLPIEASVILAREFEPELCKRLRPESLVILASRRRFWRTGTERLAATLRREGWTVLLVC